MKRQALLIGNTDAEGTIIDINNWKKYLQSGIGGAWKSGEIEVFNNPSKLKLCNSIESIKRNQNDFVLVAFAGHGNWYRSTNLYFNPQGEYITESEIQNLAPRQINCLDCCRGIERMADAVNEADLRLFSSDISYSIRVRYDTRMMQAAEQQVTLYACSIGESAYCTSSGGGFYTKNLLDECINLSKNNDFVTVNTVHRLSAQQTTIDVFNLYGKQQTPDICAVRCIPNQQLIIGLNIKSFI